MVAAILRNHKSILIGLNAMLAAAVVGSVSYALMPVQITPKESKKVAALAQKNQQPEKSQQRILKNYNLGSIRSLRASLGDSAMPENTAVPMEQMNNLNLQLLGTVIEPGYMYGIFKGADGIDKVVAIGKKIDRAEVMSVNENSATVKYDGQLIVLKVVKQILSSQAPGMPTVPAIPAVPGMPTSIAPGAPGKFVSPGTSRNQERLQRRLSRRRMNMPVGGGQ